MSDKYLNVLFDMIVNKLSVVGFQCFVTRPDSLCITVSKFKHPDCLIDLGYFCYCDSAILVYIYNRHESDLVFAIDDNVVDKVICFFKKG